MQNQMLSGKEMLHFSKGIYFFQVGQIYTMTITLVYLYQIRFPFDYIFEGNSKNDFTAVTV